MNGSRAGIETVVPFYGDDWLRRRNLARVKAHLEAGNEQAVAFPLWIVGGEARSPGTARNLAVELCVSPVVVFNDADSICPFDQIVEAVRLAAEAPGLVFAYTLYVRRDEQGREQEPQFQSPSMACAAISLESFEQVGGFDPEYVGWGYEDLDFALRCNRLWPNRRVDGPVYHLWHGERRGEDDAPVESDPAQVRKNRERWQRTLLPTS